MIELTTPRNDSPAELHRWIMDFIQRFQAENRQTAGEDDSSSGTGSGRVPTGAAMWWALDVPPDGYFALAGQVLDKSSYPQLYSVYGELFNTGGEGVANFRLPNATGRFPKAGASGIGGGDTATIGLANLPNVALPVTDPQHTHSFTGTAHSHGVTDPQHSHTLVGVSAEITGTLDVPVGVGASINTLGPTAPTVSSAPTGISIQNATAGGTNAAASTGISVQLNGGENPITIDPPWWGGIWIVRAA